MMLLQLRISVSRYHEPLSEGVRRRSNIVETNNLKNERGIRVRGFEGIGIVIKPDAPYNRIYDEE